MTLIAQGGNFSLCYLKPNPHIETRFLKVRIIFSKEDACHSLLMKRKDIIDTLNEVTSGTIQYIGL